MTYVSFPASRKKDFTAIGRLCIDLNANEINRPMEETMTFTKYVGGSPANITIGMSRLGMETAFIGKIAGDQMGRFIQSYLEKNGIDTSNVVTDNTGAVTGLAFTEIKSPTDCSILMYRDNVADLLLQASEVQEQLIADSKVLLISGTALAQSPSREAVIQALTYAKNMALSSYLIWTTVHILGHRMKRQQSIITSLPRNAISFWEHEKSST